MMQYIDIATHIYYIYQGVIYIIIIIITILYYWYIVMIVTFTEENTHFYGLLNIYGVSGVCI
jgi:hypothetical protein